MNSEVFISVANSYFHLGHSKYVSNRRFCAIFGAPPNVVAILWDKFKSYLPHGKCHKHFLWALNFVMNFSTEQNKWVIFKCEEKSFRKWTWEVTYQSVNIQFVIFKLLILISFLSEPNRFGLINLYINRTSRRESPISIDDVGNASVNGTDCQINKPQPSSPGWYSHKFHRTCRRYEVGLSVGTGRLVWVNCAFKCGSYPDNQIATTDMKKYVFATNFFIADKGYTHRRCISNLSPIH